ncbi:metal ABC transporter ATP-binding protein [Caldisalinibacter kiritimatiensis]|uniref:Zinc ABC transporter, ATP-binding protein ZnuC n=1 Tax=Caldisalinibacter kiritimatiensis TaxID=1304284 RepID=R1CS81_9FIRM|nr:metal ABC transporter ATP-binding protein [Caldisalinibacter kiritimatiensis]EOD01501.1 Zinc ABC transporter, ATP-binding protein ZnuC [Caldisalinibacter kiritimatiensis]
MYDIEVKNVSIFYDSVCALKDINFKVKRKQFLGIIGPNGGGKTTLLKLLLGIIKPSSGTVKIRDGRSIGYVPQFSSFDKKFPIKVLDVVLMGLLPNKVRLFHRFSKKDIKKVEQVMEELGILEFKDRQIGKLSGGQLQKVLIARALVTEPNILLLDEPTASIDANAKTEIYKLLKKLNEEKTIILVSHDIGIISSYIDSIACLNKTLYYHDENNSRLDNETLKKTYGCPIDLITHGTTPHRVLKFHEEDEND